MSECNLALNANVNLKEQPNGLYVHGSVMVYTAETEVMIEEADIPGINSSILLLKLTITPHPGPMKGIPRHFSFEKHGSDVSMFTQVQVISNQGESCTVNISVFG
ncbi:hypothetical protein [Pseudoalteromonas carrageenovora]|uniref:hypothetical protein n=1 Tax=Pseudoalteromonas carrageenovora TaxID=227 RepID=UPI0026E2492A|nr:hypothetical protein [Pseudoalteromonas carrageenovora]MDO6547319.1 hypothetical protein [Pseudoalteromonas carrageenovora]MDO6831767.1 hypothetical protein [Pseudoalteromonas carrageenovora]